MDSILDEQNVVRDEKLKNRKRNCQTEDELNIIPTKIFKDAYKDLAGSGSSRDKKNKKKKNKKKSKKSHHKDKSPKQLEEHPKKPITFSEITSKNVETLKSISHLKCPKKVENQVEHAPLITKHYNTIRETVITDRDESPIIKMRNFNNWIKSVLINQYISKMPKKDPIRVLDLGCGKGGDLKKWLAGNVSHLVCADISEESVNVCKKRYAEMNGKKHKPPFTAEFLSTDCTKNNLREMYSDRNVEFNLVSCQFAFHYALESQKQLECMLKNITENLKSGSYFIGTIPNKEVLVKKWLLSNSNTFGNNIYSIEFLCDKNKIPLFGAKYNFCLEGVVNCPEFFVEFDFLKNIASRFGLKFIMSKSFIDFYKDEKDRYCDLLLRMMRLDKKVENEFKNLQKRNHSVSKKKKNIPSLHTQQAWNYLEKHILSKQEWEVISLYMVFAFRKES